MLPTGNCSHHGSVEGEGGSGGEGGGQPSRTITRKLKGWRGEGVIKAFRTRGHLHTQCARWLLFTGTAVLQVSSWVKTNKIKMSGTSQRSNSTAGRMEQVRVAAVARPVCVCVWGAVHTYRGRLLARTQPSAKWHAHTLTQPPPRSAHTCPFQHTRCR